MLDRGFRSSDPHLLFVGFAAERRFGPIARFVYGSRFSAYRVRRKHSAASVAPRSTSAARARGRRSRSAAAARSASAAAGRGSSPSGRWRRPGRATPELRPKPWYSGSRPVGQLELVALAAAEVLDAREAFVGRRLRSRRACSRARASSGPAPGRTRAGGRTCSPRARTSSGRRSRGRRAASSRCAATSITASRLERGAVELHADRSREARAVRPALPAQRVQPERLLERGLELVRRARHLTVSSPSSASWRRRRLCRLRFLALVFAR